MSNIPDHININNVPNHVAVIMDGNGRWAKKQGKFRVFGHKHAITSVRDTVEAAAEIGVKYLTLYAFSTENWKRPKLEVTALMNLLVDSLNKELPTLNKNKIRLNYIGDINSLPSSCKTTLLKTIEATSENEHMTLTLALSYSSRWEILEATKKIADKVKSGEIDSSEINEELFNQHLCTTEMPDPELMIRTSGEHRISNFLLWQLSYAELYFTDKLWPDFRKSDFFEAIANFQNRERRFGLTTEQLEKKK